MTVARYWASACSSAASAAFLLVIERQAVEDRRGYSRAKRIKTGAAEGLREIERCRSTIGGQVILGRRPIATPICARRMHIGFGCPDVGPLIDELPGRLIGKLLAASNARDRTSA
jgi:hypothetical protein